MVDAQAELRVADASARTGRGAWRNEILAFIAKTVETRRNIALDQ